MALVQLRNVNVFQNSPDLGEGTVIENMLTYQAKSIGVVICGHSASQIYETWRQGVLELKPIYSASPLKIGSKAVAQHI
jgi:hypothetical protein